MITLFHGSYMPIQAPLVKVGRKKVDYENGIITAEQALGQLRYKEVNHQICILNQEIIDKYLKHTSSEILKMED
ncbi:MAG: hypothetical protein PUD79_06875 [Prevotellaceae bacterium]|nr:hypothetical protein [Prevotellaceae bacterium]